MTEYFYGFNLDVRDNFVIMLLAATLLVSVPDSSSISCYLKDGDRISGKFIDKRRNSVRIQHTLLGRVSVPDTAIAICEAEAASIRDQIVAFIPPPKPSILGKERLETKIVVLPMPTHRVSVERIPSLSNYVVRQVVVPLAPAIASSESKVGWKRSLSVGYTVSQGNANSSDLGFNMTATRRAARSQIAVTAKRILGKRDGKSSTDYQNANLRYDRALGPADASAASRPSFFSEAIFESDPFAKLQSRVVSNTGISIPLSIDPKSNLALEIGVGVTHDKQQYQDDDIRASGVLRLAARQTFGVTKSDQQVATFPDYSDKEVKYRINTNLNFAAPISAKLSLRMGLINRYNTRPSANVKKSDTTIQTGIGIEF